MTQEEQRILIAEAEGWKEVQPRESCFPEIGMVRRWLWTRSYTHKQSHTEEGFITPNLPNYFNDTNAVIEACNAILTTSVLKQAYARELARRIADIHAFYGPMRDFFSFPEVSAEDIFAIANATAAQRATALVAVIRKHIKTEV